MERRDAYLYVQAALSDLEAFLISDVDQWNLGLQFPGRGEAPPLTLGMTLLCWRRIAFGGVEGIDQNQIDQLGEHLNHIRRRWRENWRRKSAREFGIRLRSWQRWLDDFLRRQTLSITQGIEGRLILTILEAEAGGIPIKEQALLLELDERFKRATHPGRFIWEGICQPGFPEPEYWYMYRTIPKEKQ
ncbi:MAG TPA: hypothetical protein VIO61_08765 [Anaerolineaceae bacterium]